MNRYIIYIVVGLAVLGGLWYGAVAFTDARLRRQIEAAEQKASQAEQALIDEQQKAAASIAQAKSDMQRYRQDADRQAKINQGLLAERKVLLDKLKGAEDAIARAREDAANVPASELLARLRRALAELRKPVVVSRPPAQ